ncbi:MAG TPA: carbon starvation CstA family protein [Chthoniobacteraceae bacterium]|nr:carbon starvation CstA family protein [Chthoniobacteraceae bacterium]
MKRATSVILWLAIALLGAFGYATITLQRDEPLNSGYIVIAALCTYAIGYRFYSKWIAAKVLMLDDRRATPCEVHEDGKDFVKTNKWIVFGHHFAAISGPGPLVGPVLAAQFGYLPGTLWILIGVVLGGAVQDFIILVASMRRDGRSLGQMVKEELSSFAGVIGVVAILSIMIILLAVLALVVVKALAESPWGVFTVGATIPIAMFMGGYLRYLRVGKVLEVSFIGIVLLLLAVWGGQLVHKDANLHQLFLIKAEPLAWSVIAYGFLASVLPVWLLLAPRDYLSTFMKLGTIAALALGTLLVLPDLKMPAISKFVDGSGPIVPGKLFPFCFITIACGAISGFHTLISSGITPKIITRESHARPVGYGAMCLESLVAVMAMIAASTLEPGTYLAMNIAGKDPSVTQQAVASSGFTKLAPDTTQPGKYSMVPVTVSPEEMQTLATQMGEVSLFGRTGGAATLAVGMAKIFGEVTRGRWLDLWYHFALMFEALFILTTLDAGTRVGRYLLQDTLGRFVPKFGDTRSMGAGIIASLLIVIGWGFFLIMGVRDPDGGVKALWPIFGIANQMLAAIAMCFATTILIKMQLQRGRSLRVAFVTLIPLVALLTVTVTAGTIKVWDNNPKIGFLAAADAAGAKVTELSRKLGKAAVLSPADIPELSKAIGVQRTLQFNSTVDAFVTATFLILVSMIFALSVYEWWRLISRAKEPKLSETEPVWLPAEAVAPSGGAAALGAVALGFSMIKELSGQADADRAQARAEACDCVEARTPRGRQNVFLSGLDERYRTPRRCC